MVFEEYRCRNTIDSSVYPKQRKTAYECRDGIFCAVISDIKSDAGVICDEILSDTEAFISGKYAPKTADQSDGKFIACISGRGMVYAAGDLRGKIFVRDKNGCVTEIEKYKLYSIDDENDVVLAVDYDIDKLAAEELITYTASRERFVSMLITYSIISEYTAIKLYRFPTVVISALRMTSKACLESKPYVRKWIYKTESSKMEKRLSEMLSLICERPRTVNSLSRITHTRPSAVKRRLDILCHRNLVLQIYEKYIPE